MSDRLARADDTAPAGCCAAPILDMQPNMIPMTPPSSLAQVSLNHSSAVQRSMPNRSIHEKNVTIGLLFPCGRGLGNGVVLLNCLGLCPGAVIS